MTTSGHLHSSKVHPIPKPHRYYRLWSACPQPTLFPLLTFSKLYGKLVSVMCSGNNHRWRTVYEEGLLWGPTKQGFECADCGVYVRLDQLTPAGIGGTVTGESVLYPHHGGGVGQTGSGKSYRKQIRHTDGTLEIAA